MGKRLRSIFVERNENGDRSYEWVMNNDIQTDVATVRRTGLRKSGQNRRSYGYDVRAVRRKARALCQNRFYEVFRRSLTWFYIFIEISFSSVFVKIVNIISRVHTIRQFIVPFYMADGKKTQYEFNNSLNYNTVYRMYRFFNF